MSRQAAAASFLDHSSATPAKDPVSRAIHDTELSCFSLSDDEERGLTREIHASGRVLCQG